MSKETSQHHPRFTNLTTNLTMKQSIHDHSGDAKNPTITFLHERDTGWYLSDNGEVRFTSLGLDNIIQNSNYSEFKNPVVLNENNSNFDSIIMNDKKGILYKKKNSDGLWWKTQDRDINLVNISGINGKFGDLDNVISGINGKFGDLDNVISGINGKFGDLDNVISGINGKFGDLDNVISGINGKFGDLDNVISGMNKDLIKKIEDTASNFDNKLKLAYETIENINNNYSQLHNYTNKNNQSVDNFWEKLQVAVEDLSIVKEQLNAKYYEVGPIEKEVYDKLNLSGNTGILFKKNDNDDIWWKTSNVEINITNKDAAIFKQYLFLDNKDTVLRSNNMAVYLRNDTANLSLMKSGLLTDVPLMVPNILADNGNELGAGYGFKNSFTSGMNLDVDNSTIIISSDGYEVAKFNKTLTINNNSLLLNNSEIGVNKQNKLYTGHKGINEKNTYVSTEIFTNGSHEIIRNGDIVGYMLDNPNRIAKINGGLWENHTVIKSNPKNINSIIFLHNNLLVTCEDFFQDNVSSMLISLNVLNNDGSIISNVQVKKLLLEKEKTKEIKIHLIKIILIRNDDPQLIKFAVISGAKNNGKIKSVFIRKINIQLPSGNSGEYKLLLEEETEKILTCEADTFDAIYENTNDLDSLIIGLYCSIGSNIDILLVSMFENDKIQVGGYFQSINPIPILSNIYIDNAKLHMLLLPGQIVIFSYSNIKFFVLLSSNNDTLPNVGNYICDSNSVECADIIYDSINGAIISAEKMISGGCYIQIFDIFVSELKIIKSKKINCDQFIPLSLYYNITTNHFILFNTDNINNGYISAQIFKYCDEQIIIQMRYLLFDGDDYFNDTIGTCNTFLLSPNRILFSWNNISYAIFNDLYITDPHNFLGISNNDAKHETDCEVSLRGQIYSCDNENCNLPSSWIGKIIYFSSELVNKPFPKNLTISPYGNVAIGTVLSTNKILIGIF